MPPRVLYDCHMHTPLCKHAKGEPEEYAEQAIRRGLKGITFTCHNPMPDWETTYRMELDQFDEYLALVRRAAGAMRNRCDVRLGLENDFVPGLESYLAELRSRADFDYMLGSIHPQAEDYISRFWGNDPLSYQRGYFDNLARAAESGLFDSLSHPDLVKNSFPDEWSVGRVWDDICSALDRIAVTGVAMELNTSGLQKAVPEMNPGPEILLAMRERGIPVVLGSDSHRPDRVAADFERALGHLKEAGYQSVSYYIQHERFEVGVGDALRSLQLIERL